MKDSAWSHVMGQTRAKATMQRSVSSGRLAHAYLFSGPQGVGKKALAIALARTVLAGDPPDDAADERARRLKHPDLHVLMPQPSDASSQDVLDRLERMAADPYEEVSFSRKDRGTTRGSNKQAFYSVERVHTEIAKPMSFEPFEGRHKVCVITDAHSLTAKASNAFLKLLEEPSRKTLFILTTDRPDLLLTTVRSRCQILPFERISSDLIATELVNRGIDSPLPLETVSRIADGSMTRALEIAQDDSLTVLRKLVITLFRSAYVKSDDQSLDLVDSLAGMSRDQVTFFLDLVLRWIRDLILFKETGDAKRIVNSDQIETIRKFCDGVPDADLESASRLVEDASRLVGRNVQLRLILIRLVDGLHETLRGRRGAQLLLP